ncbi:TadE/TadG family type IV pilus assembly protein [Photobacterium sp. J15]|uniref:TadE/TadG family type IV pilus assembly protein n=1 Tax=Photobacterium sp. J15 TaxID=265901 RepID=UPI0007E4C106|nr:TadE/TadG family type IV pilus assembly protein [Photobacterium sp. J15]
MRHHQKGAASIIFMMVLPLIIGSLAFSVHITQELQAHAKLTEATEVASLALISTSTGKNNPDEELAKKIVNEYMPFNLDGTQIKVGSEVCDYDTGCVQRSGEPSPFSDFTVGATTKHKSWMPNKVTKSTFKVSSSSITRKYLPQPVDIYFVVDMSESMSYSFSSDRSRRKLDVVKSTIVKILDELTIFNKFNKHKSRVAFIGYHHYNIQRKNGKQVLIDQVVNDSVSDTISDMFNENKPVLARNQDRGYKGFEDIPLTDDYDVFKRKLSTFRVAYPALTESWQGVIRAAQVTNSQRKYNPEQAIIVLSDGQDGSRYPTTPGSSTPPQKNYLKTLVNNGLCERIVNNLERKRNRYGEKVNVTFGVIGIDFLLDKNTNGFYDCVGEDKIFHAKDGADVYKYILNLLNEETGRLKS